MFSLLANLGKYKQWDPSPAVVIYPRRVSCRRTTSGRSDHTAPVLYGADDPRFATANTHGQGAATVAEGSDYCLAELTQ